MKKIIISIKPEYVNKIINGSKKFEFRTKAAKRDIKKIIIYETIPVKKVVAEAEIVEVLALTPDELWAVAKKEAGVSKEFFDSYFKDKKIAYAYKLGTIKVYDTPKDLIEFGIRKAPQSFVYVS